MREKQGEWTVLDWNVPPDSFLIWFVAPTEPFFNSSVETFDPFRRDVDQIAPALIL